MQLKLLNNIEFDNYAKNHPLSSYHQSSAYALFMTEKGFSHDFIAFVDENNSIKAASLILYKKIGRINKYGYAPKGFLIDYYDTTLLKEFTEALKKYYHKKNFSFIKINSEIPIGEIDIKTKYIMYNNNITISDTLENLGYIKLGTNLRFEALLPRFNAVISLKDYSFNKFSKSTRNKIRKSYRKGLSIVKGTFDDIDILYKFIKKKKNKSLEYYKKYCQAFAPQVDIFLIKIDFEESLINAQELYEQELIYNEKYNKNLVLNNSDDNMNKKMESDKALLTFKNDIIVATQCLRKNKYNYIAGAITIKYQNRISILISGYNTKYQRYSPNYFLHYKLCEYYKNDFDYIDLNGITGDFSKDNPYYGLTQFKLGFNPRAYEYLGEFDLVINKGSYNLLDRNGMLIKEFNRKQKV